MQQIKMTPFLWPKIMGTTQIQYVLKGPPKALAIIYCNYLENTSIIYKLRKQTFLWSLISSSSDAPAWENIGAGIIIGGLHATMKLLSSIQAQVIQSLVTFQRSSNNSFPLESPRSEVRKRRYEAPEKS